jgi:hypothetical protein
MRYKIDKSPNEVSINVISRLIKRLCGQLPLTRVSKLIKNQKCNTKSMFSSKQLVEDFIPGLFFETYLLNTLYELITKVLNMVQYLKSGDVCQEARDHEYKLKRYQKERNSLVKVFLPHTYANTAILIKQVTWFIFTRICYSLQYVYLSFLILLQKILFNFYNSLCIDQLTSQSLYNRKLKFWECLYLFLRRKVPFINWLDVIKRLTIIFNFLFMLILMQSSTSVLEIFLEVKEIPEISILTHLGSLIVISWIFIKFIHFFRKFKSVKFVTLLIFVLFFSLNTW